MRLCSKAGYNQDKHEQKLCINLNSATLAVLSAGNTETID